MHNLLSSGIYAATCGGNTSTRPNFVLWPTKAAQFTSAQKNGFLYAPHHKKKEPSIVDTAARGTAVYSYVHNE